MKKIFFLTACILASYQSGFAQLNFLPKIGAGFFCFDDGNTDTEIKQKARIGFVAGAGLQIPITERVSIQPELLFSNKGGKEVYESDGYGSTDKTILNYIEVPILAQYNILGDREEDFNFFAEAGPYLGVGVNGKVKSESTGMYGGGTTETPVKFKKGEAMDYEGVYKKRLDMGVSLGTGIAKKIGKGKAVLDLRYNLGLTNLPNKASFNGSSTEEKARNRSWVLSIGYAFPLLGGKE